MIVRQLKFGDMRVEIIRVTPDMAKAWLKKNSKNRNIRPNQLALMGRDMKNRAWHVNGDTICIAKDGVLFDGQHRLQAIINSGKSQVLIVVTGLEDEARKTKDAGAKRSPGDMLKLAGERNSNALAAVLRMMALYAKGGVAGAIDKSSLVTNSEIEETLEVFPDIRASVDIVSGRFRPLYNLASGRVWGFLHYIFSQGAPEEADIFLDGVMTGIGFKKNHSIFQLRKRLVNDRMEQRKIPARIIMILIIKAWNLFREGRECKALRVVQNEGLPKVA